MINLSKLSRDKELFSGVETKENIPKLYFDGNIPNHIIPLIQDYNFEMSSYNDCDFVISCKFYAETTNSTKKIQDNLNSYLNIYKKVIVFLICDFADDFFIPSNVFLFRTSIFRSRRKKNEYVLPYVWESFLYKDFIPFKKDDYPIVGFCGRVDKHREALIKAIQNDIIIKNNFILKKEYWGGKPHDPKLISDFVKNIENSHFTICNRGNGNYSMRLYQTLSLGRIPIIIDTDQIFPFDNEINWNEIAIIGRDEKEVIIKIKYWWVNYDIEEIQLKCKNIFEKYFNSSTFLGNIIDGFYNNNNNTNKFIFPIDFDLEVYKKYNDLKDLNSDQLINHYINFGNKENRLYKLPEEFNVNTYRILNPDISNLNYEQLIEHYVNFGKKENRNYI
jgi:hypothetical protein